MDSCARAYVISHIKGPGGHCHVDHDQHPLVLVVWLQEIWSVTGFETVPLVQALQPESQDQKNDTKERIARKIE